MPAPSMVASAHADYTTTTASKSVNIAVEAGDLLVVLVACEDHATTISEPSTAGLTYVLHNGATAVSHCRTYIYSARASTTGTVAVAATASGTSHLWGFSVLRYRNVLQIGTSVGTIGSGAPAMDFTTTMYESTIVEIIGDWNGNDGVSRVWRDINGAPAIERRYARTASRFGVYVGSWNWTGAVGAKTTGLTAPSMTAWTASALELQGTPIPATVIATAEAQDATVRAGGAQLVQEVSAQSAGSSTSLGLTLPGAPTAGNLLVLAMAGDKDTGSLTLPGFTQVADLPQSSTSLYLYYKTSDGTETTINPSWSLTSTTGNMAWYGEYADPSPGTAWAVSGSATHVSDNSTATSWPTGTTPALPLAGLGIAVAAVDSNTSVTSVLPWDNAYAVRHSSTGGSGRGAVFVAEKAEPAGSGTSSAFNFTGTADQVSAAIAVFSKTTSTSSSALAEHAPITATANNAAVTTAPRPTPQEAPATVTANNAVVTSTVRPSPSEAPATAAANDAAVSTTVGTVAAAQTATANASGNFGVTAGVAPQPATALGDTAPVPPRGGVSPSAQPAPGVSAIDDARRNLTDQPQGGTWGKLPTNSSIEVVDPLPDPPAGTGITRGMRTILGQAPFGAGAYGAGAYSVPTAVTLGVDSGALRSVEVAAGQWYSISGHIRVDNARNVRVLADWKDAGGRIIVSNGVSVAVAANTWGRPVLLAQAPVGATQVTAVMFAQGSGTSQAGQITETTGLLVERVEPGAPAGTYFDGNTPGGAWEGAPFESVSSLPRAETRVSYGDAFVLAQEASASVVAPDPYVGINGSRRAFPGTATATTDGVGADERLGPVPFAAEVIADAQDATVGITGDLPLPAPAATATASALDATVRPGTQAQAQTAQATTDASPVGRARSVAVNAELAGADALARGAWTGKGAEPPLSVVTVEVPAPTYYEAKQPPVVELLVEAPEPSWRTSYGDALQLQPVGFEVRVISADDYTTVLAVLTEWIELVIGPELSAAGNGSITLDMDSPFWLTTLPGGLPAESILDREHLFEVWEEGQLRFPFFGTVVKENLLEESGSRGVSISGPGIAEVLSWGRVFSPGFPTPTAAKWVFNPAGGTDPVVTMAGAWLQLLDAAKGRGSAVARVQPTFTAEKDSQGVNWPDTANRFEWIPELGPTLLEVLDTVTGQVTQVQTSLTADWRMDPGFKLHMAPELGQDRSAQVIFHDNNSTKVRNRTRQRDEIYNYVVVRDTTGAYSLKQDPLSQTTWGLREWIELQHDQVEAANRDKVAQVLLDQRKDEKSEWVIRVQYGVPGRMPFKDFQLGDQVGVQVYKPVGVDPLTGEISGGTSVVEKHRVLAIVLRVDSQENVDMELTLQSRFQSKARQLFREMTKVMRIVRQP